MVAGCIRRCGYRKSLGDLYFCSECREDWRGFIDKHGLTYELDPNVIADAFRLFTKGQEVGAVQNG